MNLSTNMRKQQHKSTGVSNDQENDLTTGEYDEKGEYRFYKTGRAR